MEAILCKTLTETLLERVKQNPEAIAFRYRSSHAGAAPFGVWNKISFKDFYDRCQALSLALMDLGIEPGQKVAVVSKSRPEWSLADFAIMGARAVTVPLFLSAQAKELIYVLTHSDSVCLFVEDLKIFEWVVNNCDQLPKLKTLVLLDPLSPRFFAFQSEMPFLVTTLGALLEQGQKLAKKGAARFEKKNLLATEPSDLFTIAYTSGTTGLPKGVMLSHQNMMSVLKDSWEVMGRFLKAGRESTVSFLPLSHVMGRVESYTPFAYGFELSFCDTRDRLLATIAEVKPTFLFGLPSFYESVLQKFETLIERSPQGKKGRTLQWAHRVCQRYEEQGGTLLYTQSLAAKKRVYSKLKKIFGGRLQWMLSGGAPIAESVVQNYHFAGLEIIQCYGLTETCGAVTLNPPVIGRPGSVGRPLRDVEIKLATQDSEILIRSQKVFKGYYKMPQETARVLKGGRLYTGDLGTLDEEGFLSIIDRKRDLIILANGHQVAPQKIELKARQFLLFQEFMVLGQGQRFLTAIVTLRREKVIEYAIANQLLYSSYKDLMSNPHLLGYVQYLIDELNRGLLDHQKIRKFAVLPEELTIEAGELTPSQKVRRVSVEGRVGRQLKAIYETQL